MVSCISHLREICVITHMHYIKARSGFQDDIDEDLKMEANMQALPDWKKHVFVLIDEIKIKEILCMTSMKLK